LSGTHNCKINGNVFRDIAGNGVSIGLTAKETESNATIYNPSDPKEIPAFMMVSNNYFTRVGKDNMGAVGIMYAYVRDTKVMHNEIENVPYSGISGGWGWDSTRTQMCNNTISKNYIHDYMNFFYDGAGIYTLSNQPNSFCENNYVENMRMTARGYGWCGIYFDEGSRNFTIQKNVIEIQQDEKIEWLSLQHVGQGTKDCKVIGNYTTSTSKNDNHGEPQPIHDTHYHPKADWPQEAKDIIKNAGLEDGYKDIKYQLKPQNRKINLNSKSGK